MSITVDVRGEKEARALLDTLSGRDLQNRTRRGTRAGAKLFREEVRRRARAQSEIPDRFAKTRTRGHRTPVGTSTGPSSPLLNIFEGGAGRHRIGQAGQILSSFEGRRQAGPEATGGFFFARGPVNHPGMSARPLIGPIFDDLNAEASEVTLDSILEGIRAR